MLKLYLFSTLGCFLGWIRFIPLIAQYKWLSGLFYFIAIITLGWCCLEITNLMNEATTDNDATKILLSYFGYLFSLTILLYFLIKKYKKQ
ncbi:hypothetical protein [Wielerella bovis]|uniref:hypothetical protein n=1 Tax=Wielerella bovis TaxID=2917790 RepID=UPI00201997B6|nr:hypothetical protein [Wielerella bovis]ULJ64943.1 hypothetical protein MIS33_01150 [Wielerella bovis]ULJ67217.1 hypothetical protein MIS31_01155 [Wielerella bovis]